MDVGFTAPGRGRTAGAGTGTVSRKRSRKGNDLEALNLRERLEFNYIRPLNPITLSRILLSLSLCLLAPAPVEFNYSDKYRLEEWLLHEMDGGGRSCMRWWEIKRNQMKETPRFRRISGN